MFRNLFSIAVLTFRFMARLKLLPPPSKDLGCSVQQIPPRSHVHSLATPNALKLDSGMLRLSETTTYLLN
jgi:hypothetical protein